MAERSERPLPAPGEVVHLDMRPAQQASTYGRGASPCGTLKLLTWNIERGYELDAVISSLAAIHADVLSLQEVDIGCERSGGVDTGAAIASALGLNHLFICEFKELHSPLRDARSQGGGVHGNAILSKYDFASWHVVEHSHHPVDWEAPLHALARKEPRKGRRLTLAADVLTPQGPLTVYCCHLEVFCGILGRVWQFSDILTDARRHGSPTAAAEPLNANNHQPRSQAVCRQAILGDLNTMANGIARLSLNYCCDAMRWRSLRWSEAEWWERHVLSCKEPGMASETTASNGDAAATAINTTLLRLGLPEEVCRNAVNPGFSDPFDARTDITLDNPAYRFWGWHLMTGKLDWALLRRMRVVSKAMGNHDYSASDHKWLLVEVLLD